VAAVLAITYFGAPVPAADHAVRAVLCALSMQKSLDEMKAARATRGEPPPRMGVELACHVQIPIDDSAGTVTGLVCF
jgi:hypothetical protein